MCKSVLQHLNTRTPDCVGGVIVIDQSQAQQLLGKKLHTRDGDKVGTIGQIYFDDYHGQPEWVTVNTGLFGTNESFVPLAEATVSDEDLVVPYTKDQIKDAPNITDSGHLSEAEERDLYEYYNIPYTTEGSTYADTTGTSGTTGITGTAEYAGTTGTTGTTEYADAADARGTTEYDTSGTTTSSGTDSAMTRSEERVNVGTERVQTGKARLRKWVETENVQVDVPVKKEKAVLVTEPVTDANRDAAYDGPDITERTSTRSS